MNMKAATIPQPLARSRHLAATESQPPFRAIARPLIDIVVAVLNEEKILQKSVTTLDEYMAKHLPYRSKSPLRTTVVRTRRWKLPRT